MSERRPIALVTGGGRGMGLACAVRLAQDCEGVALLDRDADAVERAMSELRLRTDRAIGVVADVTSASGVKQAVAEVASDLGPPTVLVNAAGVLKPTRFLSIDPAEWDSVVGVSLNGSFLCAQACLPAMVDAGWGRIVNFSSTAGRNVSTLGGAHYTAAKAGVLGLTRSIAKEFATHGICVNSVCPGLIDTEMVRAECSPAMIEDYAAAFPVGRLGEPEEVAELVGFLCGPDAAYITGAALDINGGDLMI